MAPLPSPPGNSRVLFAVVGAAALHALLFLVISQLEARRWWEEVPRERIDVEIVEVTPEPPPPEPEPPKPEPPKPEAPPPPKPEPRPEPPVVEPPVVEPPVAPPPMPTTDVPPTVDPDPDRPSPVRLPKGPPSKLDRVMGLGPPDPFGNTLDDLSGALAFRADGPLKDTKRAARKALRNLQQDMAAGDVERGLADDYLRVLRNRMEAHWLPKKKDLLDGGASLDQLGMMKRTATSADALADMWKAYEDIAGQYARGEVLRLEPKRKEKLRELFRSRNGAFRFTAALEVVVTQAPSGELLTIETEIHSGHPVFDDAVRGAVAESIKAMPDPPPWNLHRGGQFKVRWRLRATWRMVPPTAFFSGASFDISRKGVDVDIPFEIVLRKRVLLIDYDNRSARRD